MKSNFERIPPHSIEAEQSILGGIFVDEKCLEKIIDYLPNELYFYKESHRSIYKTILKLFKEKKGIDILTVTEELDRLKELDKIGGSIYISSLSDITPSTVNIEEYAKIVRDKAILRELIDLSNKIAISSYNEEYDSEELLKIAESKIFDLANQQLRRGYLTVSEILVPLIDKLEDLYKRKKEVTGVQTYYTEFDKITSGLQPSDLIIIAARPGMGKTSLGLNIAYNVANRGKKGVAIFSLEMSDEQLCLRILSLASKLNLKNLRDGKLTPTQWKKLFLNIDELSIAPLYIIDRPGISILEIQSISRRLKKEKDIQLIVIDYLQLIETDYFNKNRESREQQISLISRSLKSLARELKIPVVTLSQLNRSVEARKPPRPMLSDLRESGAIEQDADLVIFIYRDEYYYKDNSEEKGTAEILIEKHRNGPLGAVKLAFTNEYASFENLAQEYES